MYMIIVAAIAINTQIASDEMAGHRFLNDKLDFRNSRVGND